MKILTFDIEDWFHILDNDSTKTQNEWKNFDSRIHKNMDTIYKIIETSNVRASFFVVGWMAKKYPDVIREIKERGYEIGSHSQLHQLVYEQTRNDFFTDVEKSIKSIEDCTGTKIKMFRAPGFSITEKNKWAFEVLYELGIEIDSSVFPTSRAHGGMPTYGFAEPSILKYNGVQLKEFPINTHKFMGKDIIYTGGGYFRLIPYSLLKKWTEKDTYVMSYLHPRDLDPDQPIIKDLSYLRRFKSYVGLKTSEKKLQNWITDFEFIDIATAIKQIDWASVKKVTI